MPRVLAQTTVNMPRLMEVGEYKRLRFAGDKPSLQQLKKWIEEGTVSGEVKGDMYFVDLMAELNGSADPLLAKMLAVA